MATVNQHGGTHPEPRGRLTDREGPAVPLTASVPALLVAQLDILCEQKGWNRSEAITQAIRALLKEAQQRVD
jgi:hypothetical protein